MSSSTSSSYPHNNFNNNVINDPNPPINMPSGSSHHSPQYDNLHHDDEVISRINEEQTTLYQYPMSLRIVSFILSLPLCFISFMILCGMLMLPMKVDNPDKLYGAFIVNIIYFTIHLIVTRIVFVLLYITLYGITPKSCRKPYNTIYYNILFGWLCYDEAQRVQYNTKDNNIKYHNVNDEIP